jgi:hypothetical protein
MNSFNSFEEINNAYPLRDGLNERYYVSLNYCYVLSDTALELEQRTHPYGWYDKSESKWHYFDTIKTIWYDCYIFDGEKWVLGVYTWDGIIDAEEPEWGEHVTSNGRALIANFKTLAEAKDYAKRKLKERLEF